jgi:hypothetical protein
MRDTVSGLCCDDFHANADQDSTRVDKSRCYQELIEHLRAGCDCLITDIACCCPSRTVPLREAVTQEIPELNIEYIYFENDPDKCRRNIYRRASQGVHGELGKLDEFAPLYRISHGVIPLPVWDES